RPTSGCRSRRATSGRKRTSAARRRTPACSSDSTRSSVPCTSPPDSTSTAIRRSICSSDERSERATHLRRESVNAHPRGETAGATLRSGVAGRDDRGSLRHQDDRAIRSPRAVRHAFRNDEAFESLQIDRAVLEIDDEVPLEDKEELIVAIVLVPVILALHHPEADDGVVDLAECLVVPAVPAVRHERRHVDYAERRELDVEMGGV